MSIDVVLQQMIIIFLLILAGFLLYRKNRLTVASSRQLSFLIVNFCNPALLICSVLGDGPRASGQELLTGAFIILSAYGILFLCSLMIPRLLRVPKEDRFAYRLLTLYGNVGFIGIPLVSAVLGPDSLIYVSLNNLVYNLLIYTHGIAVIKKAALAAPEPAETGRQAQPGVWSEPGGHAQPGVWSEPGGQAQPGVWSEPGGQAQPGVWSDPGGQAQTDGRAETARITQPADATKAVTALKPVFLSCLNAGTVSAAITLFLYLRPLNVPVILSDTLDCIGRSTTFLSMLVLGVSVAQLPLREIFVHGRPYVFTLLRMVLLPVGCLFLFRRFTGHELAICTTVLLLAVPAGNMPLILCKEYGVDHPVLARGIVLTTLLSLLTIPLVTLFV